VISLRARGRRRKLRPLLGPKFSLGFVNRTTKSVAFRTTYRFK
jgi:hypothetical protein